MNTIDLIKISRIKLQYQTCGYGPNGIVVLPAGTYYVTKLEQNSVFGTVWVQLMQCTWTEPVKISLSDYYKLLNYKNYA